MSKFMALFRNMDLKILPIVKASSQPIWHLPFEVRNFYLNQIFALTRVKIYGRAVRGTTQNIEL